MTTNGLRKPPLFKRCCTLAIITIEEEDLYSLLGVKLTRKNLVYWLAMQGTPVEKEKPSEIDVEVFPNRPDMLSVEGLARNLKGILSIEIGLPNYPVEKGYIQLNVDEEMSKIRPFIAAGVVRNITFTDQLIRQTMQLQEKIHETHGRKRRKVSIGLHDLEKVHPPFFYVPADPMETSFVPLQAVEEMTLREILEKHPKGIEYGYIVKDKPKYPLIVDSNQNVLSFPPIINGTVTEVTPETKNLFIDVTGTDFIAVSKALNIVCSMFAERGASIESVEVVYPKTSKWLPDLEPQRIKLSKSYAKKMLGAELKDKEIKELLLKMRHGIHRETSQEIEVMVPAYRVDVMHQMDLIEDLAIAYGYNNFTPTIPSISTSAVRDSFIENVKEIRLLMAGMEFVETLTFIQTSKANMTTKVLMKERNLVEIRNPVSSEFSVLRDILIPSLLEALRHNRRHPYPQRLFEAGFVAKPDDRFETGVKEEVHLAFVISHSESTYTDAKAVTETLATCLNRKWEFIEEHYPLMIDGRTAMIKEDEKIVGYIGEIHPQVLENFELTQPVASGELNLSKIL